MPLGPACGCQEALIPIELGLLREASLEDRLVKLFEQKISLVVKAGLLFFSLLLLTLPWRPSPFLSRGPTSGGRRWSI